MLTLGISGLLLYDQASISCYLRSVPASLEVCLFNWMSPKTRGFGAIGMTSERVTMSTYIHLEARNIFHNVRHRPKAKLSECIPEPSSHEIRQ